VGHEPVGFRAVHGFQRRFLLGKGRVELVVAAALLLHALDEGAEPVGGFQQPLFFGGEQLAGDEGRNFFAQFFRQKAGHAAHALGLQRLVGVPQGVVRILDGRGHVAGDDLRRVVVQRRHRYRFGAAGGAGVPPRDQAQHVCQQRGITGVLTEGFGPGGVHQAPAGDVLHAGQQGAERIQHGRSPPLQMRTFLHHTCPAGACQAFGEEKFFF